MNKNKLIIFIRNTLLLLFVVVFITSCGSSSGRSTGGSASNSFQMGGAIQGKILSLVGQVTTFAGAAPGADGTGSEARMNYPSGLASYGTYLYLSDQKDRTIRRLDTSTNEVITIAGNADAGPGIVDGVGKDARFNEPTGITTDGANIYLVDRYSPAIRKILIATSEVTTLVASTGLRYPTGIASDGTNLYVTDRDNHVIRKIVIATGMVSIFAGMENIQGSSNGVGTAASFRFPGGIATDGTDLYVADSGNHTIRVVAIATGEVTTLAGTVGTAGSNDGTGASAMFSNPTGITNQGPVLYVADTWNNTVRKVIIATGIVTTVAGDPAKIGAIDGIGASANFSTPSGITVIGSEIYISDSLNNTIRKINISTTEVITTAGVPNRTADGIRATSRFYNPIGATTDGNNLYVTDFTNHTIRKINIETGEVTTIAGVAGELGLVDGIGTTARFFNPMGITTDGANLFIAEDRNSAVRKIVLATGEVTTLVSGMAMLTGPGGITTDGTNLYVTDIRDHTIRKIVIETGAVTVIAGTFGLNGSADGLGTNALFNGPEGITTDGENLYIADSWNRTIRKIVISTGEVSTLAGTAIMGGYDDGIGASARFSFPLGITTDGTNLYIGDDSGPTIRKIVIETGQVTTMAGTGGVFGSTDGMGINVTFAGPAGITTDGDSL